MLFTTRRLERSIERVPIAGCWIWTGALNNGYGWIGVNKTQVLAHRAYYELYKGPIPDGLLVLHRCDVRCCINPEHLYVGTYLDNGTDKSNRNASIHETRIFTRRLTPVQELEVLK